MASAPTVVAIFFLLVLARTRHATSSSPFFLTADNETHEDRRGDTLCHSPRPRLK